MSYGYSGRRATRDTARASAQERARELRQQQTKKEKRRKRITWLVIIIGVLVIAAAVVVIMLLSGRHPASRGPLNMASDGIKIGQGFVADVTPGLEPGEQPTPSPADPAGVIDIKLYVDYLCPNCGSFEKVNGDQLRAWVQSGGATLEIHPIAVLTTKSLGTQYSLRAANAAACVAEYSPNSFFEFNQSLFTDQPAEDSPGLTDGDLEKRAEDAGVDAMANIKVCIEQERFKGWVQDATDRALNGPIPNSDVTAIASTPTVIVNGHEYKYTSATDPNEFAQFVVQAAGESFTANATPSPAPTAPTPTPTPTPTKKN